MPLNTSTGDRDSPSNALRMGKDSVEGKEEREEKLRKRVDGGRREMEKGTSEDALRDVRGKQERCGRGTEY